jgi:hypothetical protein
VILSEPRKFIFIEVPKTGSTAVREGLLKIDGDLLVNQIPLKNGKLVPVGTHISASDVKSIMGAAALEYTFVAFIRDPRSIVLSKYYFYRQGRPWILLRRGKLRLFSRGSPNAITISTAFKVVFARLTPVDIWMQVYPFRHSWEYVCNNQHDIIVDFLGLFDELESEFKRIFSQFGYRNEQLVLEVTNKTNYVVSDKVKITKDLLIDLGIYQNTADNERSKIK